LLDPGLVGGEPPLVGWEVLDLDLDAVRGRARLQHAPHIRGEGVEAPCLQVVADVGEGVLVVVLAASHGSPPHEILPNIWPSARWRPRPPCRCRCTSSESPAEPSP